MDEHVDVEEEDESLSTFRRRLEAETERLTRLCSRWEVSLEDGLDIPNELQGDIRSTIGQAKLVLKERLAQFGGLIDRCELNQGEKLILCSDLKGFWDMIYFQVEDVDKKFNRLSKIECNQWKEVCQEPVKPAVKLSVSKKVKRGAVAAGRGRGQATAGLRAMIAAKRKGNLVASGDEQIKENEPVQQENLEVAKTFDGGFFTVKSPSASNLKSQSVLEGKSSKSAGCTKVKNLNLLRLKAAKRMSWIVSPKVSKLAKKVLSPSMGEREDEEVPARKYSLFEDDLELYNKDDRSFFDRSVFD